MAKLKIGGTILYNDLRSPVPSATVQIYDLDQGGNGHDLIFSKRTGSDGKFGGISSEWNDRNTITITTVFGKATVDTPDVLALEFRVNADGRQHKGPFIHIADYNSAPIILPWGPKKVEKADREVLHLITLSDQYKGTSDEWMYKVIEFGAESLTRTVLAQDYRAAQILTKANATLSTLKTKLQQTAARAEIKAVDLVISPHGLSNRIYFYPNEEKTMSDVARDLLTIPENLRRKFRVVFSTACFGATHCQNWLNAGFKTAAGSRGISADGALSYPAFMAAWIGGRTFRETIDAANAADAMRIQDGIARNKYLAEKKMDYARQVDSFREMLGDPSITITSFP